MYFPMLYLPAGYLPDGYLPDDGVVFGSELHVTTAAASGEGIPRFGRGDAVSRTEWGDPVSRLTGEA